MTYLRRFMRFCCALLILFFLCTACSTTTMLEDGETDTGTGQKNANYGEMAVLAVEQVLKDSLRNPESLQIHSASIEEDFYEDDSVYFCTAIVDYSAQNGFGGYNRDTIKNYVEIVKADGTITELDEAAYFNRRTKAQFGDGLCSISESIPMQFICSEDKYSQLRSKIIVSGEKYHTFTYKNGEREISYVTNLGKLEGTATFYFYSKNEKIYQINFFWSDGQSFYDGTNAYTLGTEYIATLEDVYALTEKIDNALKIPHGEIRETTETYFHDYECRWNLTEGIFVKLSWTVNDIDGSIGHIQLLLCNEINSTAE